MSDQTVSLLVGVAVVILIRLLDWAFPKGYVWRQAKRWSVPLTEDEHTIKDTKDIKNIHDVADQNIKDIHDAADQRKEDDESGTFL